MSVPALSRLLAMLGLIALVGLLPWLSGADPARTILRAGSAEREATPEVLDAIRERLGLNGGPLRVIGHWLAGVVQGDLGDSWISGGPVGPGTWEAFLVSLGLMGAALGVAVVVAALIAAPALRAGLRGRADGGGQVHGAVTSAVLTSLPEYLLAPVLLLVLSVGLGLLPPYGWGTPEQVVLPALALGLPGGGLLGGLAADAIHEAAGEPWVESWVTAGIRGRALARGLLRRALAPLAGQVALVVVGLTGGAVAVEKVFAVPGIGRALLGSATAQDVPALQAGILMLLTLALVVGALAQLVRRLLLGGGSGATASRPGARAGRRPAPEATDGAGTVGGTGTADAGGAADRVEAMDATDEVGVVDAGAEAADGAGTVGGTGTADAGGAEAADGVGTADAAGEAGSVCGTSGAQTRVRGPRARWRTRLLGPWRRLRHLGGPALVSLAGAVTLVALVLAGQGRDPLAVVASRLERPSLTLPLGADALGRDVLARVSHGAVSTAATALAVTLVCLVIGVVLGLAPRASTGPVEVANAAPPVLAGLIVAAVTGPSALGAAVAVATVGWAPLAAHTAALVAEVRQRPDVLVAPVLGEGRVRITCSRVLPAVLPTLVGHAALRLPGIALALAGLGFLGLGAQAPTPEWGLVLAEALPYIERAPWAVAAPAAALVLLSVTAVAASRTQRR